MIRFLHSTRDEEANSRKEARWKKCPICEDSFKMAETRPVRFYAGQESPLPGPGHDVVLRLMVRDSGSTLALPNEGGMDPVNVGEEVPWHFAANVLDYARIMKGTNDYMASEYDREIEDLRMQSTEDEIQFGVEDGDWTIRAIRSVAAAKDKLKEQGPIEDAAVAPTNGPSKAQTKQPASHPFQFYSAPPHLYLSPLDIRILKARFGDYSNFPSTLLPRVEHASTGHVVDDVLRRRAKYLAHLPHGCVVTFLECDWTDIVPAEILGTFSGELETRRKSHRDKDAQEERERVQAERLEAAAIGRTTRRHFDNTTDIGFDPTPALTDDDFQPLGSTAGTTPPNPRPGFEQLADMSTSPSTSSKTVWGTRVIAASPDFGPIPETSANDGWLKDDEFLGPAEIALQMEAFGIDSGSGAVTPSTPGAGSGGGGGGGKKKKKQKITLMSTGGRRGN